MEYYFSKMSINLNTELQNKTHFQTYPLRISFTQYTWLMEFLQKKIIRGFCFIYIYISGLALHTVGHSDLKREMKQIHKRFLIQIYFVYVFYKCVNTSRYQAGWCSSNSVDLYLERPVESWLGHHHSEVYVFVLFPSRQVVLHLDYIFLFLEPLHFIIHPTWCQWLCVSQWYWLNCQTAKRSHWKVEFLHFCFWCVCDDTFYW